MSSFRYANPWCTAISSLLVLCTCLAQPAIAGMCARTGKNVRVDATSTHAGTLDESNHPGNRLNIETIEFENNHWVPADVIRKVIKTRPGDRFDRLAIMNDLRAIEKLGFFDANSIRVIPEMASKCGVRLRIRVGENALVRKVTFVGNRRISTSQLDRLFLSQLWKPRNPSKLQAAIDEIEKRYRQLGCRFIKVEVLNLPNDTLGVLISETDPTVREIPKQTGVLLAPPYKMSLPTIDERIIQHLNDRAEIHRYHG